MTSYSGGTPPEPSAAQVVGVHNAGTGDRHPVDLLIMLLLIVGFFLGPMKLLGASWLSYLSADGLAVLILTIVFGERLGSRRPLLASSPLSIPIILLAVYCFLEIANPNAPFIRSLAGLRSWLLYTSFYFVGFYTFRSTGQLRRLYTLLLILGFTTAIYGIYQWQAGPEAFASWSDYYGRYASFAWLAQSGAVFRAFSTFVMPGAFGTNMALVMLLAFSVAISPRVSILWRVLSSVAFVVMGAGIAASGSRGPVAHLVIAGVAALVFLSSGWKRISVGFKTALLAAVGLVGVGTFIGPIVNERFATMIDPLAFFWKWFGPLTYGLSIAGQHVLGLGLGYTAGVPQFIADPTIQGLPTTNIDSGYGSAAAEMGFLGLAIFVYFASKVAREGLRAWKGLPVGLLRDLLLAPALYAVTFPIVSLVFQPQAALPSAIYSWLFIGILMKAPTVQRQVDEDQLHRSSVLP